MLNLLAAAAIATLQVTPCTELPQLALPDTRFESAAVIAAGIFEWPPLDATLRPSYLPAINYQPKSLPAFCQVKLTLTPTPESRIGVEIWLPEQDWNGKLLAVGNGTWGGAVQYYHFMEQGLLKGYAVVGSDTGHTFADGPRGRFALNHPQKIIDFAYRAVHLMTVRAKQVVMQRYDRTIDYSYFHGCSTGGRQGVMAAQRYPGDFDGIIATALANRHIEMHIASVAQHVNLYRNPTAAIDAETAAAISKTILQHCDTHQLGFVQNPQQCRFDLNTLRCGDTHSEFCLSDAQMQSVTTFYQGVHTGIGAKVFAGQPLGNALPPQLSSDQTPNALVLDTVRYLGFQSDDYDWKQFELDRDLPLNQQAASFINADDADLQTFKHHGGKLLLAHGWRDPAISAYNTVEYYENVLTEMGAEQSDWLRLFMIPGVDHCAGGPGPYEFDALSVLENWREHGNAPDTIPATNPQTGLSQPLCAYPSYAQYQGEGDVLHATNWQCTSE